MRHALLFSLAAAVVLMGTFTSIASADVIYVDFGTNGGSASGLVGGGSAVWNAIPNSQYGHNYGALKNDVGTVLSNMSLKYDSGFNGSYGSGGAWNDPSVPWSVGAATSDGLRRQTWMAPISVTLYNLTPSQALKISLLTSTTENNSWQDQDYIINGQNTGVFADNGSDEFNAYTDGWVGRKIMVWDSVLPDVSGELVLTAVATRNDFWLVNAMMIEPIVTETEMVPEPGSAALMLLGAAGLVRKRRRS